ncbi:protein Brevis radix-like 1 [Salvia divinorum]
MALKVSGTSKGKPGATSSSFKVGQRSYPEFETSSEGVPYPYFQPGSSSTPAWHFMNAAPRDSAYTAFGGDDMTPNRISSRFDDMGLGEEDGPKEWMAQVEPGVQITFVTLPRGGNDLKRIRFSREMFDKSQAQRWWSENFDRIMELYNVQKFNQQALNTPGRSECGRDSTYSRLGSVRESPRMTSASMNREWQPRYSNYYNGGGPSSYPMEGSRDTTASRDEDAVSISNASEVEGEWIEEDEPGVYITIRQLVDGTRELRRVRFSRERFGEVHAKQWWDTNRDRIQAQYLS